MLNLARRRTLLTEWRQYLLERKVARGLGALAWDAAELQTAQMLHIKTVLLIVAQRLAYMWRNLLLLLLLLVTIWCAVCALVVWLALVWLGGCGLWGTWVPRAVGLATSILWSIASGSYEW